MRSVPTITVVAFVAAALANPAGAAPPTPGSIAICPGAQPRPERRGETDHRGTPTLAGVHVDGASADTYTTEASADAVLAFYRRQLQRFGAVTECRNGTNRESSVRVDETSLNDPAACHPGEFGEGDTELKAQSGAELVIVSVRSTGDVREFAVVDVRVRATR